MKVLACARSVGEVAIVTLSTRPWVSVGVGGDTLDVHAFPNRVLASAETYLPNFDFPALLEAHGWSPDTLSSLPLTGILAVPLSER
eukprot:4625398-Amphidinium_carterae.1